MPFLAKGALANWHDLPDDRHLDFNTWHMFQHIPDQRCRRGVEHARAALALDDELGQAHRWPWCSKHLVRREHDHVQA